MYDILVLVFVSWYTIKVWYSSGKVTYYVTVEIA